MTETSPRVAVLMGSSSDWPTMKRACDVLETLGVASEAKVISAHRNAGRLVEYIPDAERRGVRVFIAGAGGAAHLAGVVAAHTLRPVLAVPIKTDLAGGLDSLLSMVQMPPGIPVGTLAVGNWGATNAGILAAQILATEDEALHRRLVEHRKAEAAKRPETPE
jgi:5-(carboxyamino)imidazole ribonucleotide mutase